MTRYAATVEIHRRAGIADPEAATIERALPALGFASISGVQTGKAIRLVVEAADEAAARASVDELCRRFLTNPVMEQAEVRLEAVP